MPSDLATSDLVYTLHEKPTNGSRDQFPKSYKNFLMLLRENDYGTILHMPREHSCKIVTWLHH